jgi:chromosome segregation ATPase
MGFAPLLAVTLLLASCRSGDPHQDDLFGGIAGIVSGDYRKRSDEQEQRLLQTQAQVGQQEQANQRLAAVADQRAQTVSQLQRQVGALRSQAAVLRRRINKLTTSRTDLAGQVEDARARQVKVQAELDDLSRRAAAGGEVEELNERKAVLMKEIAALNESVDAIETRH